MKRLPLVALLLALLAAAPSLAQVPGLSGFFGSSVGGGIIVTPIGTNTNVSGSTLTLSGVNVPAGALIVIVTIDNSSSAASIAVTGNSVTSDQQTNASFGTWTMSYVANATAISGGTITYTKGGSQAACIGAFYATGIASSSPLDTAVTAKSNGGSGTATSVSITGSGSAAQAGELAVGITWVDIAAISGFANGPEFSDAFPFAQSGGTFFVGCGAGYKINATTAAPTYTASWTGAARWATSIYSFKHP